MANVQQINALSRQLRLAESLVDIVWQLKRGRQAIDALQIGSLGPGDFPLAGELDHLTRANLAAALAAMDLLDKAFLAPTALAGQTRSPQDAILNVLR